MSEHLTSIIRYFADRRRREWSMARSARCRKAREAHRDLARRYNERVSRLHAIARLTGIVLNTDLIGDAAWEAAPDPTAAGRTGKRA